ncbi:hypothetical protein Tco_1259306, partial [Tanacetum coccineum]
TSSTANDSPVDNMFNDTRDFDHDSFSRFTENPDDRAALMNKITDMQVDFQRRITATEQYLKISTSSNVEKTSFESDVDTKNVDNHSMDFDHDPKTSFEYDLDTNNVDNHSMDVDHDAKALEEPIVAGNNLFQEEDQQFSSKNLDVQQETLEETNVASNNFFLRKRTKPIFYEEFGCSTRALEETNVSGNNFFQEEDQQFSAKKLDAQLEMEERFAVDTLCSMIDFDFPTEDLFCPSNAPKMRVNVPKEIINFLRETKEQYFYFPWSMDGTFVCNNFWQGLLGIGKERRGWLSDTVLDKKNIDPANYSITYRYTVNVPMQGDAYGDCGILVMRNMYRLVNNLSLEVSNPTQLGLAYMERLINFFWKYKIPIKQ